MILVIEDVTSVKQEQGAMNKERIAREHKRAVGRA
jgi:hypothetical protein